MSIQKNQYVIYGVKLPYNHFSEEEHEALDKYIDSAFKIDDINPGGVHVLADGMNGKYVILGRCLKKSSDHQSIDMFECDDPSLSAEKEIADVLLKHLFDINPEQNKLMFVTHYR